MGTKEDEVVRKFSKTFRKVMLENRENSSVTPSKATPDRSVKFSHHTMETSLGGTHSLGRVKFNDSVLSSMSMNSSCTSTVSSASSEDTPVKSKGGFAIPAKPEDAANYVTPVKQPKLQMLQTLREEVAATPECYQTVTMETPRPRGRVSMTTEKDSEEDTSSVTVAVRCRPFSQRELAEKDTKCIVSMDQNMTTVCNDGGSSHKFSYDYSFWSFDKLGGYFASQEYVYNTLAQPLLGKAFEGYNVCLFAYGQTGSGKSYSIMGHNNEQGIIPRFCEELFGRISSTSADEQRNINVEISFFEIYNEKIHDLLGQTMDKLGRKATLKVREHPALGPFVEGLSSYVVKNYEDVEGWLNVGNKHRATAATAMNDKSSRSHSVFTMVLTQSKAEMWEGEEHQHSITSKINLVDLAGSERQSSARTSGDRLKEGSSINKSLLNLGKVISLLAERSQTSKKVYISYRDSVLTWLLKESLGGNSKTTMLATISPANLHMEETLSTLRYAQQASKIVNSAKVNEDPSAKLIRELRAEIERLRRATGVEVNEDVTEGGNDEIEMLRLQLLAKEQEMDEMTRSWQERLKQSEERKLEEAKQLEKSGISFKVDNKEPNLVNLSEDPLLSETLLYILKDGLTRVGRMTEGSRLDIQLRGPLIEENHCTLTNYENTVSIKPIGEAQTYVNGNLITGPTVLHHSDRVILGGDHYFRFNHPGEVMDRRSLPLPTNGGVPCFRDFEFARQELMQVQNEKLQAELEEVKREAELERQKSEAKQEMLKELERKRAEAEEELNQQQRKYEEKLKELQQTFKAESEQDKLRAKVEIEKLRQEKLAEEELILQQKKYEEKIKELQQTFKAESEQDKMRAKEEIEKLRHEKMVLEQGILGDRKSLQLEAEAAQRAVVESRQSHSRIVEQLELEKQKIVAHVERLQAQRNARGKPLPGLGVLGTIPVQDGIKKDLMKILVLLREASKIMQYFNKDVFFSYEYDENDVEEESDPWVKVQRQSLEIWTFWGMNKFESRLLQLREIYQNCYQNGETTSGALEEILNDPNDTWEKRERLFPTPSVSPRLRMAQSRKNSVAQVAMRRSIDSSSPASPVKTPTCSMNSSLKGIPEKGQNSEMQERVPVIGVCRELIALSLDNFKGPVLEQTLADKVLVHCELVKTGVTNILDAFNKALDNKSKELFLTSEVVRIGSIQISCSLRQLLTLCALWTSSYNGIRSVLIQGLCDGLMSAVRQLGSHLALFMQGCENDMDKLVQSSASQLLTSLLSLCQHAGELALASDMRVSVLNERVMEGEEDDETRLVLSDQVKQDFLSGCDNFVDKTFQKGIKALEDCESRVRGIVDEQNSPLPRKDADFQNLDLYSDIEVLVSSAKVLLQKCQRIQFELDTTLRDSWENKPDRYYHKNYHRSVALVEHASNFADKLNMLVEVAGARYSGKEEGSLRKIYRNIEIIERSGESLVTTAIKERNESDSQDSQETTMLSDVQVDVIEVAGHDLQDTVKALREKVKKLAVENKESNSTPRREITDNKSNKNRETPVATPRRKLPKCPEDVDSSPRQEC